MVYTRNKVSLLLINKSKSRIFSISTFVFVFASTAQKKENANKMICRDKVERIIISASY